MMKSALRPLIHFGRRVCDSFQVDSSENKSGTGTVSLSSVVYASREFLFTMASCEDVALHTPDPQQYELEHPQSAAVADADCIMCGWRHWCMANRVGVEVNSEFATAP